MIVYIVSRTEHNHTAVWAPFASETTANGFVDTHAKDRIRYGAVLHRDVSFPSVAVMSNMPMSRQTREVEVIAQGGDRTVYTITQHPIVEDTYEERPFLLTRIKK